MVIIALIVTFETQMGYIDFTAFVISRPIEATFFSAIIAVTFPPESGYLTSDSSYGLILVAAKTAISPDRHRILVRILSACLTGVNNAEST